MTSAKSILGCEALGYAYPGCTHSFEESATQLHRRALDWRYGLRWQPLGDRSSLINGDLAMWSGGASSAPDDFTLTGAGATIARISGDAPFLYAARVTRAGADATLGQGISMTVYRRLPVAFGMWVKTSTANQARLSIVGTTTNSSSYHNGNGTYQFLRVERLLTSAETTVTFRLEVNTTNGSVDVMGGVVLLNPPYPTNDNIDQTPQYPMTSDLYLYPCDSNELRNWSFFVWSDGGLSDPDHWVKSGSGSILLQPVQISSVSAYFGPYLLQIQGSGGGVTKVRQTLSAEALARAKGRYVRGGAWTHNAAAGNATVRVVVLDRAGNEIVTTSSANAGTSAEWLTTASAWVPNDATGVAFELQQAAAAVNPRFWGCLLHIGASAPAQTPHAKSADYFAIAGHNLGTQGLAVQLQGTNAERPTGYTTVSTITPTTDKAQLATFNSASYTCWRVRIARVAGAQAAEIGMIAFGSRITLPSWLSPGFLPYDREVVSAIPIAAGGTPIGRHVRYRPRKMRFEFPWVNESELLSGGTVELFLRHATSLRRGTRTGLALPFFFAWEPGDHPSDVFFAWVPDGGRVTAPMQYGLRAERVTCDALVVDE